MARLKRLCPSGISQHVIQRGNNRQMCFNGNEDMAAMHIGCTNFRLSFKLKFTHGFL